MQPYIRVHGGKADDNNKPVHQLQRKATALLELKLFGFLLQLNKYFIIGVKTFCLLGSFLFVLFLFQTSASHIVFNHTYLSQMAFKLKEQKHTLHSIKA